MTILQIGMKELYNIPLQMKKKGEFECLPLNSLFCLKESVANNIKSNVINNKLT